MSLSCISAFLTEPCATSLQAAASYPSVRFVACTNLNSSLNKIAFDYTYAASYLRSSLFGIPYKLYIFDEHPFLYDIIQSSQASVPPGDFSFRSVSTVLQSLSLV